MNIVERRRRRASRVCLFPALERGPIWYRTGHVTVDTYGGRADFLWREAQGDALKWKEFEDS